MLEKSDDFKALSMKCNSYETLETNDSKWEKGKDKEIKKYPMEIVEQKYRKWEKMMDVKNTVKNHHTQY